MFLNFKKLFIFVIFSLCLAPIIANAQEDTDTLAFKKKLDGAWIEKEKDKSESIINYNQNTNELIMFSSSERIQEVFLCSPFTPLHNGNSYNLVGTNDMVPFIKVNITIHMDNDNKCWFTVRESEIKNKEVVWTGSYTRMTSYKNTKSYIEKKEEFILDGRYSNGTLSMDFYGNRFLLYNGKETKFGVFAIYDFEKMDILELRFLERDGKQTSMTQYRIEHGKKNSIILTPGQLKAHGFKLSGEKSSALTKASSELH